ncbi:aromatic acid exporter family protein, partial [Streptomyces sp. NPDC048253]|uniref:aromatic acid exporter family protein n=1 Tax=Streptomyces sp. NPDC048253 TaxID=3365524 RepID=UPI003724A039
MEWTRRAAWVVRRWVGSVVAVVRRAGEGPGRERDLAVQAGKAALAAWLAWAVVGWWLEAPMAFVAPWVAVVLVEATVYRSVAHGLQQLAAIAVGTAVATAGALLLGSTMAAMALVLPAVLLLGQWQRLGSQGVYAATGALFVLTGGQVSVVSSAARIAEAVFGAVVGVAVNVLIRPPVYLRDARAALEDAAREAQEILDAVADGLADGEWDGQAAGSRHERALRLGRLVDQARSAIGWSRESMRGNPRGRRTRLPSSPGKA